MSVMPIKRKLILGAKTASTKRLSIRLNNHDTTIAELEQRMEEEGYGPRMRSRWISEAIAQLGKFAKNETAEDWQYYMNISKQNTTGSPTFKVVLTGAQAIATYTDLLARYEKQGLGDDGATRLINVAISTRLSRAPNKITK